MYCPGADPGFLKGGGGPGADTGFLKGGGGSRRGYRIFERGGVQARIQDFSQAPPPWTLSVWRHPPSEPPPPPWTLPVWRHPHSKGGAGWSPLSHTHTLDPPLGSILGLQANKGGGSKRGSNFGPNVKKPTSWPKRGGGPDPLDPPPPGSATDCEHCWI